MWIVAIAWIYVVGLMAITEPSIVAGIMTFVGYCAIPLSILFYITGGKRRRARRERAAARDNEADATGSSDSRDTQNNSERNSVSDSSSDSSTCSDSGGSDSSSH